MPAVAGAVLVGGQSRRMGRDKALVELDGRPMARVVLDALAGAGVTPLVVVGGDATRRRALGVEVVPDAFPGEGPLGGVVSALEHFAGAADHVLVTACDLPHIGTGALGPLLARVGPAADTSFDVVVASAGADAVQPLCALWSAPVAAQLREVFTAGERSMFGALARLRVEAVEVPSSSLRNINIPDQLGG